MKIKNLFEEDGDKHVTFCFGRFNPPTLGHEQVFKTMKSMGGDMKIFTSQSQDKKKNPLDYSTKINFLRKMFPQYAGDIVEDSNLNTIVKIASYLYDQGYRHVSFVAGSDRIEDMKNLLKTYNGVEGKSHGYYKFETMNFKSSGEREDGAEGTKGISATAARGAAANNDLSAFAKATGAGEYAEDLFNEVKKGMGIAVETTESVNKVMPKPRDPNWKDMAALRTSGAGGSHRDKKKEQKLGYEKHKGKKMEEAYDHPQGAELSRLGRIIMDKAITTKDDALSNVMSRVGDELTRFGAPGGASDLQELLKRTKVSQEQLLKMMKWAKGQTDTSLSKVKDPTPSKDDMEEESYTAENTPIGHVDDERNMIRKELYQMAMYAKEMFQMLEDLPADSDFPHWWQAKVVNSLAMISKAKHYLENELNVPDVDGDRTEEDMHDKDNMGFSDKEIKMAFGVLNDPRYKGGNYSGAVKVINSIAPGLADHPSVKKALQRTNEAVCSECGKARFVALPEEMQKQYESVTEEKQKGVDGKVCWKGYKRMGTKQKNGKTVDNCVKM